MTLWKILSLLILQKMLKIKRSLSEKHAPEKNQWVSKYSFINNSEKSITQSIQTHKRLSMLFIDPLSHLNRSQE